MKKTFKLEITNITWKIPHVTPSKFAKIMMYDIIKSGVNLPIAFRSWYSQPFKVGVANFFWVNR